MMGPLDYYITIGHSSVFSSELKEFMKDKFFDEDEKRLSKQMIEMWASFAWQG